MSVPINLLARAAGVMAKGDLAKLYFGAHSVVAREAVRNGSLVEGLDATGQPFAFVIDDLVGVVGVPGVL